MSNDRLQSQLTYVPQEVYAFDEILSRKAKQQCNCKSLSSQTLFFLQSIEKCNQILRRSCEGFGYLDPKFNWQNDNWYCPPILNNFEKTIRRTKAVKISKVYFS